MCTIRFPSRFFMGPPAVSMKFKPSVRNLVLTYLLSFVFHTKIHVKQPFINTSRSSLQVEKCTMSLNLQNNEYQTQVFRYCCLFYPWQSGIFISSFNSHSMGGNVTFTIPLIKQTDLWSEVLERKPYRNIRHVIEA